MNFEEQFERANRRAKDIQAGTPRALSARFDRHSGRIVIGLNSGLEVGFLPQRTQGLEKAAPAALEKIEISPSGYGIHFPKLDVDVYLPALLEGVHGTRRWMAARLGSLGGMSRSRGKIAAARKNGKLGGRPAKRSVEV
jgi:hypothetical protein